MVRANKASSRLRTSADVVSISACRKAGRTSSPRRSNSLNAARAILWLVVACELCPHRTNSREEERHDAGKLYSLRNCGFPEAKQ
jgi:hypothetical protein